MATRFWARSLLATKQSLSSVLSRSYASVSLPAPHSSLSSLSYSPFLRLRIRPLIPVAANLLNLSPYATAVRGFSTRQTSSSLNDPNPNWSNRPPKETILLDGCDFEHWLVVMEKPDDNLTRDEIIDSYIKTLAMVVGSEEEARMKIYSVSTRHYFAFGALVSEELSYKLKELPKVRWVLPDSYLDVRNKDYGGEPFINGQAVPYDPKYHEEWVRNNARANERNRRNDRPRNFDRSRNFERRRENMMQNRGVPNPGPSMGGNMPAGMPPNNMGGPQNTGGGPPSNMGGPPMGGMQQYNNGGVPSSNMGGPPVGGMQQYNSGGVPPSNMGGPPGGGMQQYNSGGVPPSNMASPPNIGGMQNNNFGGGSHNMGGMQHNRMGGVPNMGGMQPNNVGGTSPNYGSSTPQNMGGVPPNSMGGMPNNTPNVQSRSVPNNAGGMPFQSGPGLNGEHQSTYSPPNTPGGYPNQSANMPGGYPNQSQNVPGRDMPPPPNYQ